MQVWKKNLRKIPPAIIMKLKRFSDEQIMVAVVKKIPLSVIRSGRYKHLGIAEAGGVPTVPKFALPSARQGRFSNRNMNGWIVVRKDLPKTPKTYTFDAPNWGDWSKGSHDVDFERLVYRRDFHSPPELAIHMELLSTEPGADPKLIIKFQLADFLNQSHPEFKKLLFFNLNLLQENVGACDVFKADSALPDFLHTITVEWEILPPGDREGNLAKILSGRPPDETIRVVTERYDTLAALGPVAFIHGRSGFRRYFGAKFADDLVVFENIEHGNAAYVMFERWEILSQRTRLELLSGPADGFIRVIHRGGWQKELKATIQRHRRSKQNL
jgi:hypothetical protein